MKNQNPNNVAYCFAETHVKPEDITCVHAALKSVDPEMLLCVMLESHLAWKTDPRLLTGAAKRHLMKKTTSMLSLMYELEPAPLHHPDHVIIPVQTFEYPGAGCSFIRRISSAILDVASSGFPESDGLDYAAAIASHMPAPEEPRWVEGLSSVDGLISAPWPQVLGHALWLPSSLTEYERTAELAHVFWVMAFSGYAEAVHEMRVVNLKRQGALGHTSSQVAVCFQAQEDKMVRIASLMQHNSMVDVRHVLAPLKQALVA